MYRTLSPLEPHKRLVVIHPTYRDVHLLLSELVLQPQSAYIRFDGASLDKQALLCQINDAVADFRTVVNLVLDECDRARPADFTTLLTHLLEQYTKIRILILTRTFPVDLVDSPLRELIAVMMRPHTTQSQLSTGQLSKPHVQVDALGTGHVFVNRREITEWEGQLPRNLFFFMLENRLVSRDTILEALWADAPSQDAANTFHVVKATLHNILGFDWIEYYHNKYRITEKMTLDYDVSRFTHLVETGLQKQSEKHLLEAYSLFRYNFLLDNQQPWAQKCQSQLQKYYFDCVAALAHIFYGRNELQKALHFFCQVWRANHLREDIAALIMRIHIQFKQPEKALDIYWQTADCIERVLGLSPDQPLQQLGEIAQKQSLGVEIHAKQGR